MSTYADAVILSLLLFTVPSEQTWPAENDTVYIAATFKDAELKLIYGAKVEGVMMEKDLVSCTAFVVREAKPSKSRWIVEYTEQNALKASLQLDGPWLPRMHKTHSDCSAQHLAEGEPKVKGKWDKYKIQ